MNEKLLEFSRLCRNAHGKFLIMSANVCKNEIQGILCAEEIPLFIVYMYFKTIPYIVMFMKKVSDYSRRISSK